MSTSLRARSAYAQNANSIRTTRSKEYDVFAKVTSALKDASDPGSRASAISDNRHLWTILAADVANTENELPAKLRGQIFHLAEFTDHHSRKVLKGEAETDILIEINTAIMAGLRSMDGSTP